MGNARRQPNRANQRRRAQRRSSRLGSASYPTELGLTVINDDGTIASGAVLIRPAPKGSST
jgi:hypothetical protein